MQACDRPVIQLNARDPAIFQSDEHLPASRWMVFAMRQELLKLMRDLDAAAARLNAGLGAVAIVLAVAVSAGLTVRLAEVSAQAGFDRSAALLLGP